MCSHVYIIVKIRKFVKQCIYIFDNPKLGKFKRPLGKTI